MLIKHGLSHLHKHHVILLNNTILLRDSRSYELMLNVMVLAERIKEGILELNVVIATNSMEGTLFFLE